MWGFLCGGIVVHQMLLNAKAEAEALRMRDAQQQAAATATASSGFPLTIDGECQEIDEAPPVDARAMLIARAAVGAYFF